jgi:hypothetical protein
MKTAGTLSAIGGGGCLAFAAIMPTTVPTDSYLGGDSVHNIGLMQWQLMAWQLGLALLIIGAVLYVGGSLQAGAGVEADQPPPEEAEPYVKPDDTFLWIVIGLVGLVSAVWLFAAWLGAA